MKSARIAAFVLPVLCCSPLFPQQPPSPSPATTTSPEAKAAPQTPEGAGEVAPAALAAPLEEDQLRQVLTGKHLFLRGLWLSDDLHFDMNGQLVSTSPKGSFTLCDVQIDKVRLTKKSVELEGERYGIHFLDTGNWADEATSFDRVQVTPKKKRLTIWIARQPVLDAKKVKEKKGGKKADEKQAAAAKASAAAGAAEAARGGAEGTTQDPAEAAGRLQGALNRIFAPSLDAKMIAAMPDYWQYFYQAQLDHKSIEPTDPGIVRPGPGIEGPTLEKNLVPSSNEYAQKAQIVGAATYKVILGPDGKPLAIAVFRPIGFGLDGNAVEAIRKSTFAPAIQKGKAVSSVIDVSVVFRIYSRGTAPASTTQVVDDSQQNISPMTGQKSQPGLFTVQQASVEQTQAGQNQPQR